MMTMGFNFAHDKYSLNPTPTNLTNITIITLHNGIFDTLGVTRDVTTPYNTNKPTWDFNTVMIANLDGNINAGNVDFLAENVTAIRIKRKEANDFTWITLEEREINDIEDFNFVTYDQYAGAKRDYDYAIVPVFGNTEGDYIISRVYSDFTGLFIVDKENNIHLYQEWDNTSKSRVQRMGTFEPYGSKYPTIIKNGKINYEKGSVTSLAIASPLPHIDVVQERLNLTKIKDFFSNGDAKVMKDESGNMWLVMITDDIGEADIREMGNTIAYISFNWVEIGDPENQADLYNNNLVDFLK